MLRAIIQIRHSMLHLIMEVRVNSMDLIQTMISTASPIRSTRRCRKKVIRVISPRSRTTNGRKQRNRTRLYMTIINSILKRLHLDWINKTPEETMEMIFSTRTLAEGNTGKTKMPSKTTINTWIAIRTGIRDLRQDQVHSPPSNFR